jgi:hypothetical protein
MEVVEPLDSFSKRIRIRLTGLGINGEQHYLWSVYPGINTSNYKMRLGYFVMV